MSDNKFRALLDASTARHLEPSAGEHPFTYCMEHVIPAMEEEGKAPEDPKAFCGWWKAERAAESDLRTLHLRGATGKVRTEMLDGREHLVVPVVALMEGVIHAVNADVPEFVPGSRLAAAASSWNGRPLVVRHPVRNGRQCSANDPEILGKHAFGTIFNSRMNGKRLGMEAWIDPKRLEALGEKTMLADLRAGKPIEVSVGAAVRTLAKTGSYNGKAYKAEWGEISGDHLAFLPGGRGACSIEMGCGAHRAASYRMCEEGIVEDNQKDGIVGRIASFLRTLMPRGWGDDEVKQELRDALLLVEPASRNGDIVRVTSKQIIYCLYPPPQTSSVEGYASYPSMLTHWSRDYTFDNAKGFVVSPERMQVEPTTVYEPMRQRMAGAPEGHPFYGNQHTGGSGGGPDRRPKGESAESTASRLEQISRVWEKHGKTGAASPLKSAVKKIRSAKNEKEAELAADEGHKAWYAAVTNRMLVSYDDCEACGGTGQIKQGDGQMDCEACDGTGEVRKQRAAERCEEDTMTKEQRAAAIKALTECPCSGFTAADTKMLEAASDERIEAFRAASDATEKAKKEEDEKAKKAADDLKAAQDKAKTVEERLTAAEATIKAAAEKQLTEDEFLKIAPPSIRTLVADKKAQDAETKKSLVASLKAAGAFTEEELNAKEIPELTKLATLAKVSAPADYSGRGLPQHRAAAGSIDAYAPPDPYEAGLKALQAKTTVN